MTAILCYSNLLYPQIKWGGRQIKRRWTIMHVFRAVRISAIYSHAPAVTIRHETPKQGAAHHRSRTATMSSVVSWEPPPLYQKGALQGGGGFSRIWVDGNSSSELIPERIIPDIRTTQFPFLNWKIWTGNLCEIMNMVNHIDVFSSGKYLCQRGPELRHDHPCTIL